jgi:hypothetical protein
MNRMNRYTPPGINVYERDKRDSRLRRHRRLKKLRRLLGLPEKNMYISTGVYVQEHDFTLLKSSKYENN